MPLTSTWRNDLFEPITICWKACPILFLGVALWLLLFPVNGLASFAMSESASILTQRATGTSPFVGSAMAVLATLEQAQVLPPEGSREADRVIQSVIQLQSVFAKGTDPSIQDFVRHALADKYGTNAPIALERFRSNGWTTDMLEALADADARASAEDLEDLSAGLGQFNLSVDDFRRLMQLVRDGRSAIETRGQSFQEVYTHHRNAMPGATARER
ncbi:MAG: hypothetical protein KF693_13395 [Nitrospira sp.]|nr:hypothetical protein [Nitrospira sp.]